MSSSENEPNNQSVDRDESVEGLSEAQLRLRAQLADARAREDGGRARGSRLTFFTRKTIEPVEPAIHSAGNDDDVSDAQRELRVHLNALRARNPRAESPVPGAAQANEVRDQFGDPTTDRVESSEDITDAQHRLRTQLAQARAREPEREALESRATIMRRNAIAGGLAFVILAALVILSWDRDSNAPASSRITTEVMTGVDTAKPERAPAPAPAAVSDDPDVIPQSEFLDSSGQQAAAPADPTTDEPATTDSGTATVPRDVVDGSATSAATDTPITPKTVRPSRKPQRGAWPQGVEPEMTPTIGGAAQ